MAQAVAERSKERGKVLDVTGAVTAEQLKAAVEQEVERRRIIKEFVRSQLEANKDYGTIEVKGRTGQSAQSKPVLFKSGMEKIFSLFNVVSTLERDTETVEMVNRPGVIAYKCKLYRNGEFLGEGRGACDVTERGRVNDAIKIAEKRARMDACLNLGFSEYFTQDLEDLADDMGGEKGAVSAARPVQTANTSGWRDGEVRDLTFTVERKEMKNAQSGTVYALLYTDQGLLKAWKNTYDRFEEGATYQAAVEASLWNNNLSLAVVRFMERIEE